MKLMLVDDHELFLEGLKYLLEIHGINIIDTAKNGNEALVKARILKPNIILMDIKMPEYSGLDALKRIKAEMPEIKIIILTTSDDDDDLFDAVKSGASGYLLKSTNAKELLEMLSDVENGEIRFSANLASKLLDEFKHMSSQNDRSAQYTLESAKKELLNERQLEVLEMVARGITYKEVGKALGLTERTIKYHMGRIIELLHLENKAQVITYAAKMRLTGQALNNERKFNIKINQ